MRTRRRLVAVLGLAVTACGAGKEVVAPAPPPLDIVGRYVGSWTVQVKDLAKPIPCLLGFCSGGPSYEGDWFSCRAVVDLEASGDRSFVGTLALDTTAAAPYLSRPCSRLATSYLRPALAAEISNGVITPPRRYHVDPDPSTRVGLRFDLGVGGASEFERLTGCTLDAVAIMYEPLTPWRMRGEATKVSDPSRGDRSLSAGLDFPYERGGIPASCRGIPVRVDIDLKVERIGA